MIDIKIRKSTPNDVNELEKVAKLTFYDTFNHYNEADMELYLQQSYSVEKLTSELKDPNSEYYLATTTKDNENEIIIGFIKLNILDSQTEIKEKDGLEIQRIYVLKEYHGKNIGQLLMDKAIQIAKQNENINYIWLGVSEENPRAVKFYSKYGFTKFDQHYFMFGNEIQIDIMMKLNLK